MAAVFPRIGLVLGGGALKGLAHVGALRALEEAGIHPHLYAGTSIGAMIAAAAAGGRSAAQLIDRASRFRRRDLFRINHLGMLMERMQSRSIYLEAPLRALCEDLAPDGTFEDLERPLLVTAVDLERAMPVVFGRPGLRNVRIRDAVYASCALPGFFPPGVVGGRTCIDGGTTDNLPVSIAALEVDALIAIDVGIADVPVDSSVSAQGFASIFMRAASMMMHEQQQQTLEHWTSPPLLLVRPAVSHISWFSFSHVDELLQLGYDAMKTALTDLDQMLQATSGIFPRREMRIAVSRNNCTGCGLCVARAPHIMALDGAGKAYPRTDRHNWSPADADFMRCCPENAIAIEPVPLIADSVAEVLAASA